MVEDAPQLEDLLLEEEDLLLEEAVHLLEEEGHPLVEAVDHLFLATEAVEAVIVHDLEIAEGTQLIGHQLEQGLHSETGRRLERGPHQGAAQDFLEAVRNLPSLEAGAQTEMPDVKPEVLGTSAVITDLEDTWTNTSLKR